MEQGPERKQKIFYYESEKSEYLKALRNYIEEFKKHSGRDIHREELHDAIAHSRVQGVPTTILNYFDVFNILGIEKNTSYNTENMTTFSDDDLIAAVKKAFEEKCLQEAKRLNKENLTEDEIKKIKLKEKDYKSFRRGKSFGEVPSCNTLIKRLGKKFGPLWSDVLEKAGL